MCGECRAFPYAWKLSPISPGSTNGRPHLPWTLAQPSSMCSFATWRISPSCLTVSEVSTRRQKLYSLLWTTKRCDVSRYDSSGSTQLRILEWLTRALFADGSGGGGLLPVGADAGRNRSRPAGIRGDGGLPVEVLWLGRWHAPLDARGHQVVHARSRCDHPSFSQADLVVTAIAGIGVAQCLVTKRTRQASWQSCSGFRTCTPGTSQ